MRSGYKQTEVGAVPVDWTIAPLGAEIDHLEAGVSVNSVDGDLINDAHAHAVLKTSAVIGGVFLPQESKKIAPGDLKRARLSPRCDSIIISRMNTPELVGECGYVGANHPTLFLPDRLWLTRQRTGSNVCVRWLSYLLSSGPYRTRIKGLATGTSGSMKNIAKDALLAIPIAYPRSSEQCAIAAALSDVDALLDGLERLIAKKRDIKQAALQQLLTGQTRLPGFHGEWDDVPLGALGAWKGGMTPSMQNPSYWEGGDFPWISSGDVKVSRLRDSDQHVTAHAVRHGAAVVVPANSIVLVTRSGILRKYLPVALTLTPMAINQDIKALIPNETVSADYLLHALIASGDKVLAKCLKAGTTVESVEFPWLKAFSIPLPPRNEQSAIAAILSDMDAELSALEARRDKTRLLKQGMMQELLTGRTRLI